MRKEYKTGQIRPKTFFLRKSKGRNSSITKSLNGPTVFFLMGDVWCRKKKCKHRWTGKNNCKELNNLVSTYIKKAWLQNSRFFFLKISKEIGKAWRKILTREKRASLTRPVSLFVFSLVPDLLFDCSRVHTWIRNHTDCFAVYKRANSPNPPSSNLNGRPFVNVPLKPIM